MNMVLVIQAIASQPPQLAAGPDPGPDIKKAVRKPKPKPDPTPFRFLDLPAEIRNMIYELVLISTLGPMEFRRQYGHKNEDWSNHFIRYRVVRLRQRLDGRPDAFNARLLETCKQIHAEATPILYRCNEFRFRTPGYLKAFVDDWPEAIRCIRHIRFKIQTASSPTTLGAFMALREADALERLDVDWDVKDKCVAVHMPFIVVEFWRHAFLFFRHLQHKTGDCEAALAVMNFVGPSEPELYEKFRGGLAGLMRLND